MTAQVVQIGEPFYPGGGGSGATTFTSLTDAPASYAGAAAKVVRVNAGETGLEFAAGSVDPGQSTSLSQISSSLSGAISSTSSLSSAVSTVDSGQASAITSLSTAVSTVDGNQSTSLSQISSSLSGAISSTSSLSAAVSTVDSNQSTSLSQISSSLSGAISSTSSLSTAISTVDANQSTSISITSSSLSGTISTNVLQSTSLSQISSSLSGAISSTTSLSTAESTIDATQAVRCITLVVDGGGATITTGVKGYLEVPFACTINRVTVLCDQSGSIVFDIWKDTYANYPPTIADTITASAKPTVTTATKSQDASLTGWTTSISAGDVLGFNVDSVTTCQRVTLSLKVTMT